MVNKYNKMKRMLRIVIYMNGSGQDMTQILFKSSFLIPSCVCYDLTKGFAYSVYNSELIKKLGDV